MAPSSPRWPLTILLVAIVGVFHSVVGFGFVWDDHLLLLGNALLNAPSSLGDFFSSHLWAHTPDPDAEGGYYRPLLLLDLALTQSIAGFSPGAFHLHGLLWHLVAVLGVFRLLWVIIPTPWAAATGAALFALHPVQVESVSFISARNDPMAAAMLVWALILLSQSAPRRPALIGGCVLTMAALLSKESVILAPVLLALVCRARGAGWGTLHAHLSVVAGIGLAVGLRAMAGVGLPGQVDADHLLGAAGPAAAHYADRLLWPVDMAPMIHLAWPPPVPWSALSIAAVVCGVFLFYGRRHAGIGLAMALAGMVPALAGVAQSGIVVDRYLYLPMVGFGLMVAAGTARLPRRYIGFAGLTGALAILSVLHLPSWQDDDALWPAAMNRAPSGYAAGAYGRWLEDEGRMEAAAEAYSQAVQPPRPFELGCYNITRIYLAIGQAQGAVVAGQSALQAGCPRSPELVAPLAVALAITGEWTAAEQEAKTVGQDPTGKALLVRLGARAREGDLAPLKAEMLASGEQAPQLLGQVLSLIAFSGEQSKARGIHRELTAP